MSPENFKILLQYFSWPLAIILISIGFFFIFHKGLSSLISRISKIGREGLEATPPTTISSQKSSTEEKLSYEQLMKAFDSVVLREQEENIKKELENFTFPGEQEKINVLVKYLASTRIALRFSYTEKSIWGSQIRILEFLNSKVDGATEEEVKAFYDIAAKAFPETFSNYSFDKYINFLTSHILIVKKNSNLLITNLGRDFLTYLVNTGNTGFRPF